MSRDGSDPLLLRDDPLHFWYFLRMGITSSSGTQVHVQRKESTILNKMSLAGAMVSLVLGVTNCEGCKDGADSVPAATSTARPRPQIDVVAAKPPKIFEAKILAPPALDPALEPQKTAAAGSAGPSASATPGPGPSSSAAAAPVKPGGATTTTPPIIAPKTAPPSIRPETETPGPMAPRQPLPVSTM